MQKLKSYKNKCREKIVMQNLAKSVMLVSYTAWVGAPVPQLSRQSCWTSKYTCPLLLTLPTYRPIHQALFIMHRWWQRSSSGGGRAARLCLPYCRQMYTWISVCNLYSAAIHSYSIIHYILVQPNSYINDEASTRQGNKSMPGKKKKKNMYNSVFKS